MSVCRKLADGTVQKIAGHTILLDANASEVREGTIGPMIGTNPMVTVTFSDPMPDTDYVVVLECTNYGTWTKAPGPITVTDKTTTGFTCNFFCYEGVSSPGISYHYYAWKPVKIDGYTALQNKVNNPDASPTEDSLNLVTSGGVYEAIKNASAVWKGTKAAWEALPAAEKQTYDLAVLLDTTLVKAVDREDGTETDVANLNKIFRGTEAEWQALSAAEKDEYDEAVTTGEQNPVAWPFPKPDWANAVSITAANLVAGYAAPADGMIVGWFLPTNGSVDGLTIRINGIGVALGFWNSVGTDTSSGNIQCPVSTGDTVIIEGRSAVNINMNIHFVPWKQA